MSNEPKGMTRRGFLWRLLGGLGFVAAAAGGYVALRRGPKKIEEIPGRIMGASSDVGHRLRGAIPFQPTQVVQAKVVIVGAGAAGLSAAWALEKAGVKDYLVLDLEQQGGGNAAFGKNNISAYPWGAHYVPIPDPENKDLIALFEDLGVIKGWVLDKPWYEESYLCQAPHERLYLHGSWQEGLVPRLGVPEDEMAQLAAFHAEMERWKAFVGRDGRPAFAIPVARSSQDAELLAFDGRTMEDYLLERGWDSPHLHWYVDYCCRDDFGTTVKETSAWAGIHYFAARAGTAANATESDVLTWPEGNGWLMARLIERVGDRLRCGHLVSGVRNVEGGVEVDCVVVADGRHVRFRAEDVIFAGPRFVAGYVVEGLGAAPAFTYAPWVVANVSVGQRPVGRGAPLAWDNVPYGGRSLGYILADHQSLVGHAQKETVLTWYEPLTHVGPAEARKEALAMGYEAWRARVVRDLEVMHPGIMEDITRVDVWVWGHGMIRPVKGFLTGAARAEAGESVGRIHFAHSDLSGISIFEEAFYWGLAAAERVGV